MTNSFDWTSIAHVTSWVLCALFAVNAAVVAGFGYVRNVAPTDRFLVCLMGLLMLISGAFAMTAMSLWTYGLALAALALGIGLVISVRAPRDLVERHIPSNARHG